MQLVERVQMRAKGQHPIGKDLCPWQWRQLGLWFRCHQAKITVLLVHLKQGESVHLQALIGTNIELLTYHVDVKLKLLYLTLQHHHYTSKIILISFIMIVLYVLYVYSVLLL